MLTFSKTVNNTSLLQVSPELFPFGVWSLAQG